MATTARLLDEPELTAPVDLCGRDGKLNRAAVGWSRHPLHRCNLPPSLGRKKKWNYWAVTSGDFFFSATIADVERLQLGGCYLYDRRSGLHLDKTVTVAPGTIAIPETVAGDMVIDHPQMHVALTDAGAGTRIRVEAGDFCGRALSAEIVVQRPAGHETLNVVIPWTDVQFQYTSKQNTLPATGYVRLGDERHDFAPPSSYGCLDYGRGVWPEHTRWNWGAASGVQSGRVVGLNLGGQWTDGTGMTENGICIDGRLTKISEDLVFEYDRGAMMRPWRVRTAATDRIDLRFDPEFERVSESGRRDAWFTSAHQMFGTYSGRITPDGGGPIEIADLFGWIEDHEARW
ncbi:MAG TPA: DUF2804 domain-containing protein [Dehalococcoidia bacterium]|nr:DUF2804 domain-containing protein [Dehalococcoidia bacterium]